MIAHLAVLQVIVPLLSAAFCPVLRRARLAWGFAVAVSWAVLAIAIGLLSQVLATGPISYEIGNWAAPWGIEYRIDYVNAFVLLSTFWREVIRRRTRRDWFSVARYQPRAVAAPSMESSNA